MTIKTKIKVDGTEFKDYQNMRVSRNIADYNSTSNFSVTFDSPFGRHKTDFSVGQEVQIFADDINATTNIFTGVIEKVNFKGSGTRQSVILTGRDYGLRLLDATVLPSVFTDQEISTIVTSIITSNVSDITTTNVNVTSVTLERVAFNHTTVFDALKQLALLAGFIFYVDENKDLHFEQKDQTASGITVNNTNINKSTFNTTREDMFNEVWVYGARMLAGFTENFTAGSPVGGSVFMLINRPRSTSVTVDGAIQKGGVLDLMNIPKSGTNYLVDFYDKKIVFTSGPDIGNSIPSSGAAIVVNYDRDVPIAKVAQDTASIESFGKKTNVINDTSIEDPKTARDLAKAEIESSADPFKGVEANIKGWFNITPGNTAQVTLSDFNIDEEVGILDVTYTFDKNRIQSEQVIKIRLDKKIRDITDELREIRTRLDRIEASNRQSSDVLTRLQLSSDNYPVVGSYWEVRTRVLGSAFILGNAILSRLGSYSTHALGNQKGALGVVESGGFFT